MIDYTKYKIRSSSSVDTLRHCRRFSRALTPGGAAAPKRRGNAAWTVGTYEAPAMPEGFRIQIKK
jgi:hypothetical protein